MVDIGWTCESMPHQRWLTLGDAPYVSVDEVWCLQYRQFMSSMRTVNIGWTCESIPSALANAWWCALCVCWWSLVPAITSEVYEFDEDGFAPKCTKCFLLTPGGTILFAFEEACRWGAVISTHALNLCRWRQQGTRNVNFYGGFQNDALIKSYCNIKHRKR